MGTTKLILCPPVLDDMDVIIGHLSDAELSILLESIRHFRKTKGFTKFAEYTFSESKAYIHLKAASKLGQVAKFYLYGRFLGILWYVYETPWWSDAPILCEQFVLATEGVYGFQSVALRWLEERAQRLDCSAIFGGAFLHKDKMASNGYKKAGFTEEYPTFLKVLK